MHRALESLFEEQIEFKLKDGTSVDGAVYIGEIEFLPVETLREDEIAYQAELTRWIDEVWLPDQAEHRDRILKLPGNAKRFTDLRAAIGRQQVVPLIGSGMSVPSGLPTWSELLRNIRRYAKVNADELEDLIRAAAFEEAADLIASGSNSNLLNERVEHELRIDSEDRVYGAVRLLPAIFSEVVITTNLDNVLERRYKDCATSFGEILCGPNIAQYRKLRGPGDRILLKLHGDSRLPEGRVLFKEEYEAAYASGCGIREELILLFQTHHLLFLGCSLGPDRTVGLVSEVAQSDQNMPKHFAFLALPKNDDDRLERELFLTERGIYPIWYDGDHDLSIGVLLAGLLGASANDQGSANQDDATS